MKYPLQFFFFSFLLIFCISQLKAQERIEDVHRHQPSVLQKIEQDYQEGSLTLDQKIRYQFYATNNPQKLPSEYQSQVAEPIKCGTPVMMDFYQHRDQLSPSTIQEIKSAMEPRLVAEETFTSGHFEIRYETSGTHAVPEDDNNSNGIPDYVEEVAAAADSSYRHEVQNLGLTDPIPQGEKYIVEILNVAPVYGQAYKIGGNTRFQVENDFAENFPANTDPEGNVIGAIKVTVAHEFKHAIQYVMNDWNGETDSWAEMDATLMEEVVYDDVNDYYNYITSENLNSIFLNPDASFYPGSYEHITWALYFDQQFGSKFWTDVWKTIEDNPDIRLVDAITQQLGSEEEFSRNFVESQLWHLASGNEYSTLSYGFEESKDYPNPTINYKFFGSDSLDISENQTDLLNPFSAKYFEVTPSPFKGFVALELNNITEPKVGIGAIGYFKDGTTESVVLYSENQNNINYQTTWAWEDLTKVGIVVANGNEETRARYKLFVHTENPRLVQLRQNYPNPFNSRTIIQYSIPQQQRVQLIVYDVLGRKVATLVDEIQGQGIYTEAFNATDLASGIYFYQLSTERNVVSEKMTVIK
jgi:hypothetical protein